MRSVPRQRIRLKPRHTLFQRGVSIFIVIVVMSVLLGIALGLNAIFVRQLKNLRGIGDSVIALYAADAGIERILRVDICMTDPVEAARLVCIADAINAAAPASCEGEPIPVEQDCRKDAIADIPSPPLDQVLGNTAEYMLEISDGGGCAATNYCGTSAGTFKGATRKVEILR